MLLAIIVFGYAVGGTSTAIATRVGESLAPIAAVHPHRRRGRRVQADPDRGGRRRLGVEVRQRRPPVRAAARLADRGRAAPGHRLGDGRHDHRGRDRGAPSPTGLSPTHAALLALAIGAGSLFLSHVNDAGFWLVKELFGLSVGQTFKTWSVMETAISVVGFLFVLLLSAFI